MNLDKKRWIILVASCLINLCIGSLYAWSVFSAPMAAHLSSVTGLALTAGGLAIVFTVANSVGPFTMIPGGSINDKLGPKWVIFVGGLLFGGGMIMASFATNTIFLVVGYGLGGGLGMGMVYGCTIGNSIKFFPDKRGLVGGIVTATYGLSSVAIPPIANALISNPAIGVTGAFRILGIAFLAIICIGAFFILPCPAGYAPAGWVPPAPAAGMAPRQEKNWKEMFRDPVFYVMIIMLTCGAFFGLMAVSQASPVAQKMIGMGVASATTVVSILALFNAAGRVLCGMISDKIGRINTLAIVFVLAILSLLLLYTCGEGDVTKFYIGVCVVGLCFGSFMGIFPGFTADQFGAKNNSVNYGIMFIGFALAGIFGPTIMSNVYTSSGSYQQAFLIAAFLAVAGFLLTFLYRGLTKKKR